MTTVITNFIRSAKTIWTIGIIGITSFNALALTTDQGKINVSGLLKLDQRFYSGNTKDYFFNGSSIRDLSLSVDGKLQQDWQYNIALKFKPSSSHVEIEDCYLTYSGFKPVLNNDPFTISIGQVNPGFSIENTSSSKWLPFMERSIVSTTFGPDQGLGVNVNQTGSQYSITASITQPKANNRLKNIDDADKASHDKLEASGRVIYAPFVEPSNVIQLGLSLHQRSIDNAGLRFKPDPESKARNNKYFLDTKKAGTTNTLIAARKQNTIGLEFTEQYKQLVGEIEYQRTHIKRGFNNNNVKQGDNLNFHGYHAQLSYVLTGEVRPYKIKTGTFGQIIPNSSNGAWEIAARYSYINLNNKDVQGGSAHNTTLCLSWYASKNIRVLGEWNHNRLCKFNVKEQKDELRKINSLGLRLQAVF